MAILTPVLTLITNSVEHGEFTLNWHLVYLSAVGGAAAYILKNFLTPADKPQSIGGTIPPPDKDEK